MDNLPNLSLIMAIYLIGFAAFHSFLASLKAKTMARRLMGSKVDPWYPLFFSAVAVVTILPLIIMLIIFPGKILYIVPYPWI